MSDETPDDRGLVKLPVDWVEHDGWRCLFCGGDIEHNHSENYLFYVDDSYRCQDKQHMLCSSAYFMVRWSKNKKAENGDALTLTRWIELEFDGTLAGS